MPFTNGQCSQPPVLMTFLLSCNLPLFLPALLGPTPHARPSTSSETSRGLGLRVTDLLTSLTAKAPLQEDLSLSMPL